MSSKAILARRMARLRSVQALFHMEASGAGLDRVARDFNSDMVTDAGGRDRLAAADTRYFRKLIGAAVNEQKLIDRLTSDALKEGWRIDRIDPTLRALFRAAGAELVLRSAPPRVTIDEFVEVARAFYPEGKAAGFVNGVLDHMARRLRPEEFARADKVTPR